MPDPQKSANVEELIQKLNNSRILNGGFEKLVESVDGLHRRVDALSMTVDHLNEKLEDTSEKVTEFHDRLLDPEDGIYRKINDNCSAIEGMKPVVEAARPITEAMKTVNMDTLKQSLATSSMIQKGSRYLILFVGGAFVKVLWDLYVRTAAAASLH